jgi:predicted enzyme related to lactoylglutathione lyase
MKLESLDHVWFWVTDMDRSVRFYEGQLGLVLRVRHGNEWAEFEADPIHIGLHGSRGERNVSHGGTAVFRVHDLDLAKTALEQRGVAFHEHLGEVPGIARYASFDDPDGNSMQLIEYVAPAEDG